jgi:molybdopterin-guanine dinucleotide biosynthesis protein A
MAAALARGVRKVTDSLRDAEVLLYPVENVDIFENCNTPEDWVRQTNKTRHTPF